METVWLLPGGVGAVVVVWTSLGMWLPNQHRFRRLLIALFSACLAGWLSWYLLHNWAIPLVALPVLPVLFGFWAALFVVDLGTLRLPNPLVAGAVLVPMLLLPVAALFAAEPSRALRVLLGGLISGLVYLCLHLIAPHGLGLGDVKFAPSIGLLMGWHSWSAVYWSIAMAFLLSASVALSVLVRRRHRTDRVFAFGPFMVTGAVIVLLASSGIMDPCCVG